MHFWLRILTVIITFGFAKAHVRLIILALLGLAGLYMIHTLAQDYQKISQNWNAGTVIKKFFTKRSIDEKVELDKFPEVNWHYILSRDPTSCAQSFVCQLSAQKHDSLEEEERLILMLATYSSKKKETWATQQLRNALTLGAKSSDSSVCRNVYRFCPYSSETMLKLLKLFGGT